MGLKSLSAGEQLSWKWIQIKHKYFAKPVAFYDFEVDLPSLLAVSDYKSVSDAMRKVEILSSLERARVTYEEQQRLLRASANSVDVTVLLATIRPYRLIPTLELLTKQELVYPQVLVGMHGFDMRSEYEAAAKDFGLNAEFFSISKDETLGGVYNNLLRCVETDYCAKIDDDDWYAPTYLRESVRLIDSSKASVVGKLGHFVHLAQRNQIIYRFPDKSHRFTSAVVGGTIFGRTEIFRDIKFANETIGEDRNFLQRVLLSGGRVYSGSPFGYVLNRSGNNTWSEADEYFLRNSLHIRFGVPNEHEGV